MMAPVRRWSQLLGSIAVRDRLRASSTRPSILVVLILFFPQLDLSGANPATAVVFMLLGSFSFVGIGMMAAILPLLYVERGAQMTFVLQSLLLLVSGVYYSVDDPAAVDAGPVAASRRRPTSSTASGPALIDGVPITALLGRRLAADRDGRRVHPARAVGVRPGRALRQADRQAQAGRLTM